MHKDYQLTERLHDHMVMCGEPVPLKALTEVILDIMEQNGRQYPADVLYMSHRTAVDRFVDSMLDNVYDTHDPYEVEAGEISLDEWRQRESERYEKMRPREVDRDRLLKAFELIEWAEGFDD